jgi:ligand-binding sensor domain-containing protein/signal transduction histidine kinase
MNGFTAQIIGLVLCLVTGALPSYAVEEASNTSLRPPITDATDRIFVPVSAGREITHAVVGQIIEDNQGFLWFATRDGLLRYDGYRVRPYDPYANSAPDAGNPEQCCPTLSVIPGVSRFHLLKDASGKIWIGGDGSLHQYDSLTDRIRSLSLPPGEIQGFVRDIYQDRQGMIWLATSHGLVRFNQQTGETKDFLHQDGDADTLGSNQVRAALESRDGVFWVATNSSVELFDRQTGKVFKRFSLRNPMQKPPTTGNPYVRLLEDKSGTIWVASARDGLAFMTPARTTLTFVGLDSDLRPESGAWAILEDRSGAIWIGSERGLLRLDRDRRRLTRYRNNPTDSTSLPADWVLALYEDREDGIWVGTANGGAARFSESQIPFRRYRTAEFGGDLGQNYIFAAYESSDGSVWVGGKGAIYRVDLLTGRYLTTSIPEYADVRAITEDRAGQLWLAMLGGSFFRLDPSTGKFTTYKHGLRTSRGCANNEVRAFWVDHRGQLWVGAADTLCNYDPLRDQFRAYQATSPGLNEIQAISEDSHGLLWIGSNHFGLYRFDPATATFTAFRHSDLAGSLSNDVVLSVFADHSGTLWVGTANGLNKLDRKTDRFVSYRETDGLPSNIINGIVEDASGDLWITTSYGLSHFKPRSGTSYNYYQSDGVFDDLTGAWKGRSGHIFFGSSSGLTVLSPTVIEERHFAPRAVLTDFKISDQSVPIGADAPLKQSISVTKAITLGYNQNTFSFEFAALSYVDPERTRYRYRLDPLENKWNEVANAQNVARYPLIAPGEYVFRVEAWTPRGTWTEPGAEVRIVILPPWWSTWWFRLAAVAAVLLTALLLYRLRLHQVAGRLNLAFEERLAERTRIARDFHDTLLQSFQGVLLNFHAVTYLVPDRPEAKQAIENVVEQARHAITEGRNAVEGLRSSKYEGSSLEAAISKFGQELAASQPEPHSRDFLVNVQGMTRSLTSIVANELYYIATEAVRNVFQHAHARRIEVEIGYHEREFRLHVRDDGSGIDPKVLRADRVGHYGITSMRERTRLAGGRLVFWSELDSGTELELTIPASLAYAKVTLPGSPTLAALLAAKIRRILS